MSHNATFNILAFFQVVASGQISPHFRASKIDKISDMQYFERKKTFIFDKPHLERLKVLLFLYKTINI